MASQMEDPSAVLEQFIQDVANLPAEIAHLLEEVQAKDEQMSRLRTAIHGPDMVLQKHVKSKGALAKHEKEDALIDLVSRNFHEAQALQEEKVALTNKAAFLVRPERNHPSMLPDANKQRYSWTDTSSDSTLRFAIYRMKAPSVPTPRSRLCSTTPMQTACDWPLRLAQLLVWEARL